MWYINIKQIFVLYSEFQNQYTDVSIYICSFYIYTQNTDVENKDHKKKYISNKKKEISEKNYRMAKEKKKINKKNKKKKKKYSQKCLLCTGEVVYDCVYIMDKIFFWATRRQNIFYGMVSFQINK